LFSRNEMNNVCPLPNLVCLRCVIRPMTYDLVHLVYVLHNK